MRKTAIVLLALLFSASLVQAQTYAKIGDSAGTADENSWTPLNDQGWWITDEALSYTASAGDTVTMLKAWSSNNDSITFAIYEFDTVGDTPTVLLYFDTAIVSSTSEWDSLAVNVALVASTVYCMSAGSINGTTFYKGNTAGSDATRYQTSGSDYPQDPWTSTNTTTYSGASVNMFARVTQYGAGAGATTVGPTVIGPTVIGP
jgi:hypothetical protein